MKPLPQWLAGPYLKLSSSFGYLPFTTDEAKPVLEARKAALVLSRLKRTGWVDYVSRETYRVVHPMVCLLELSGRAWRSRVTQKERLPIVEIAVGRIVEEFGPKLQGLVLFGSFAKGNAGQESDIDMLLVAEGLPRRYGERLEEIRRITQLDSLRKWRSYLWEKSKVYPLLEVIPLTPEEARKTHPFYLDMIEDGIVIYEREGLMTRKLAQLKTRLQEVGASRVVLPSGRSYWSLAEDDRQAKELFL
jgi:predicted nucleotidyltransferase